MKKKLISAGFQSPNFTQVPNDFFNLVSDMDDNELRVTLVMIRETFGYHREDFTMGINKLADAAGLSRNGAKAGAEAAEERGTFRRTNPGEQGSAEWELIVDRSQDAGWSRHDQGGGHGMTRTWSPGDQQSGLNKEIKNKENTTTAAAAIFKLYETNIGPLTPLIRDALLDDETTYTSEWVQRAIAEAAASNVRSLKYIRGVLAGYKQRGSPDIGRTTVRQTQQKKQTAEPFADMVDRVLGIGG